MSENHTKSREQLVKVTVTLPASDWHSHASETMWAEPIGNDRYRLQNVPFYAYELSFEDVVTAVTDTDGQLLVNAVAQRGGHSTYRLFLSDNVKRDGSVFTEKWQPLEEIGVTYEQATERLFAIDVPAGTDIYIAYELLERGREAGVWDFEEGHCGHPVSN